MLGWALPSRRGASPGGEGRGRLVGQRRQQALHEVHLDELSDAGAVALAQREQDPGERVLAGEHVDERDPGLGGLAVGRAGDRHEPADGLDEQVVAGERGPLARAESRDRAVDGAGIRRVHVVEREPEPCHDAGPEVLDDHVGGRGEPMRLGEVGGVGQVERDRALVAVHAAEVGGLPGRIDRRRPVPGVVAGRRFDLHDVGAEVGEHHRRVGTREHPREVGDAHAGEHAPGRLVGPSLVHGSSAFACRRPPAAPIHPILNDFCARRHSAVRRLD